jgi:hypothetical protein
VQDDDALRLAEQISACEQMLAVLETDAEVDPNVVQFLRGVLAARRAELRGLRPRPAMPLRLAPLAAEFARKN